MEQFWDCSLCRIEPKALAARCKFCSGKLKGRDRLVNEIRNLWKFRRLGTILSTFAPGLGQMYRNRWLTGIVFGVLVPLCLGLLYVTFSEFSYSHLFIVFSAAFVIVVAAADAFYGPTDPKPPCQKTCPAGVPIPDYLQLIIDQDLVQGLEFVRTKIPLPGVIGRVCPHPCESKCFRGVDGEPIAINACKRFLADAELKRQKEPVTYPVPGGPRVAVVGAGPAGITCAYYLSILGARVTVYDSEPAPGGRLFNTIPSFRLPPSILQNEVEELVKRGVEFKCGVTVGPGGLGVGELMKENKAVFLSVGAPKTIDLKIEGADKFLDFQKFLRSYKVGEPMKLTGRVAVIGGGNAAIDVCRTAIRAGAKEVHLIYRRDRDQMPARSDEVEAAQKEGVRFLFLTDPVRTVLKDGELKGIVVVSMELGARDESGRRKSVPVKGSERMLEFNTVIPCLGQKVASPVFDDLALKGIDRTADGRVKVNKETGRTSIKNVFAGGDMTRGPETAVGAMADGRRAALGIYSFAAPEMVSSTRFRNLFIRKPFPGHIETPQEKIREEMRHSLARGRVGNFEEVEEGFYSGQALRESRRCLQCHREL